MINTLKNKVFVAFVAGYANLQLKFDGLIPFFDEWWEENEEAFKDHNPTLETEELFGCDAGDHDIVPVLGFGNEIEGEVCRQCGIPIEPYRVKTIGTLVSNAMELHQLTPKVVEKVCRFRNGQLDMIINDELYTNSIPILMLRDLMLLLQIPFSEIEPAMVPTFKLLLSKETPNSIRQKPRMYQLYENEEAVKRYTEHLKELMSNQSTSIK